MSKKLQRDRKQIAKGPPVSGAKKTFSQKAYEETQDAVEHVLAFLEQEGLDARPNDDKYGPDIVVWKGLRPQYYIEVEQRLAWKTGPMFPWSPVNVLERKLHLFKLGLPCEIWIVSVDRSTALVIPDYVVEKSGNLVELSNRSVRSGEKFCQVPLDQCIHKTIRIEG